MARGRGDTLLVVGGTAVMGGGRGGSRTAPTGWVKGEGGLLWLGVLRWISGIPLLAVLASPFALRRGEWRALFFPGFPRPRE